MEDCELGNQQVLLPSAVPTFGSSNEVAHPKNVEEDSVQRAEVVQAWFDRRNGDTLRGALAFVPWVLQESYNPEAFERGSIEVHRGEGCVIYVGLSGFTELTERSAGRDNGAELLSKCLTQFFTPLIDLIHAYRGDVIKFSGKALTIYFQAVDDTKNPKYNHLVPPHGSFGMPGIVPMAISVLRASACCIEIHKRLHRFNTGVDGVILCCRVGIGCGEVGIFLLGTQAPPETHVPRCEYVIAGRPLQQIATAVDKAKDGETCLSPDAWEWIKDSVIEGAPLDEPGYHLLMRMDESKYTFPTVKHAAQENDMRKNYQFGLQELSVIRRFIPSAVYKQIEGGTLEYCNEMRNISILFLKSKVKDIMTREGAEQTQALMKHVQKCCYEHEGTLNKTLIDDKGMTFLLVWGLPPMVHTDDPTRAMLAAFDIVRACKALGVTATMGLTTGQTYCGVCGCTDRMEYTVLGSSVNLASRLMGSAARLQPPREILCDLATKNRGTSEVEFETLKPIQVKEKADMIPVFVPRLAQPSTNVGLTVEKTVRFPWYDHPFGGALASGRSETGSMQSNVEQLCGLKSWAGIAKAQELLGVGFSRQQYQKDQVITAGVATGKAPSGSPFTDGGVVIVEGATGYGKVELAEHIILTSASRFKMYPILGSMGPRPSGSLQLAAEMLRSTLGVFRHLNPTLPKDERQALAQVVPQQLQRNLQTLNMALHYNAEATDEEKQRTLDATLEVICGLMEVLTLQCPILVTLQYEYGTSLFSDKITDEKKFWRVVGRLAKMVYSSNSTGGRNPLVLMIIVKDANPKTNRAVNKEAVQMAQVKRSFIQLGELNPANISEYMASYLGVTELSLPQELRTFIGSVTLGNPLFIRESIGQLMEGHIKVDAQPGAQLKRLECGDLTQVNIAKWGQTAMVGGTVCNFESLDPLESAVLKMSTCFKGSFTLPDLAASTRSKWADATHFDNLRLFKALRKLISMQIIEEVEEPTLDTQLTSDNSGHLEYGDNRGERVVTVITSDAAALYGKVQHFKMANVLMRDIGSAMVLDAQRKTVKRQALIERALARALPGRLKALEEHHDKKNERIPWYYEQAFRRMPKAQPAK